MDVQPLYDHLRPQGLLAIGRGGIKREEGDIYKSNKPMYYHGFFLLLESSSQINSFSLFLPASGFTGHMAHPGRRFHGIREILPLEPERHIDQTDQHGHFHQGADHCGKSLAGVDPKDSHGHGNGQFEIVGGGCEAQSGGCS